ncbi:hypothetical protein TFLX_05868 [Thermoflexales bacterium]|nr:hypothetical protein TFLX_05868 [Thermoflexales bacterium]
MFQQRFFLVRCLLACGLALMALLAVSRPPIATAAPSGLAMFVDLLPPITPTISIELAPGAGTFVDTGLSLPGVQYGSARWGDCNNDRIPDVLLTGEVSATLRIARVYQQAGDHSFTLAADLTGIVTGTAAWADYDNDGWLDIALAGGSVAGPVGRLYRNVQNGVTCAFSLTTSFTGVTHSALAWGDYNGDGWSDLAVAGYDGAQPLTKIYRNQQGVLTDSGLSLPGIHNGAVVWGDYDSDGWVDLLLTGSGLSGPVTKIYHNQGQSVLLDVQATSLPALHDSAAAWGDYDNDGDLDLLLEGNTTQSDSVAEIYRNDHGVFVKNTAATLAGSAAWTSAAWGDYDNDGRLDALVSSNNFPSVYHNDGGDAFGAGISLGPSSLMGGSAQWGDYENDRNLEVLLTGKSLTLRITKVYKYSSVTTNTPPAAPTNLTATLGGSDVRLHWSPPVTDDHTALAGLSYNLRVGTRPGGIDIIAPLAITATGYRLLPALGNTYSALSYTLRNLSLGQAYYWSVQAIDTSFVGSNFAAEGTFQIPHRVFLPTVLKNFVSYYSSEWETEPNNTYLQANGVLQSGRAYRGQHNDERDYYSVYLPEVGTVNVELGSPNGGTQIQLFYEVADVAHRVGFDPTAPYQIDYAGSPGWYYIFVYTNPVYTGTEAYTLTITYP